MKKSIKKKKKKKRKEWMKRKIKIDLNSIKIYLLYSPNFSNFRVYVLRGCLRVFLTNSKVGIRGRRVVFFGSHWSMALPLLTLKGIFGYNFKTF